MQNRYPFIFVLFMGIGMVVWLLTSPQRDPLRNASPAGERSITPKKEEGVADLPLSPPPSVHKAGVRPGPLLKDDGTPVVPEGGSDIESKSAKSPPYQPRTFTHETHLAYLRSLGVTGSFSSVNPRGETERLSLVHDQGGPYPYIIIHEHLRAESREPYLAYAQVADQFLVRFKDDPSEEELSSFLTSYGLKTDKKGRIIARSYLVTFGNPIPERIVALKTELERDPRIESADPNTFVYASTIPNDPQVGQLWGLTGQGEGKKNTHIRAPLAWDLQTDCSQIPVAVLDTGIDSSHPDLQANIRADSGASFVGGSSTTDGNGHGTHVAGTIGAVGNNNLGISGICWKASLIAIKVLGDTGSGSAAAVIQGLEYARTSPAKIVNMSLGGAAPASSSEIAALKAVTDSGKLVVVAAGNSNANNDVVPGFPATVDNPNKISVAALDTLGNIATFSNYGATTVDIAAPGVGILSTVRGRYDSMAGTSMAAPHVTGAAALFWSYAPTLSAKEVKDLMLANSTKETFAKGIVQGRKLDLFQVMTSVQARVKIEALESSDSLVIEGPETSLAMASISPYAKIAKVELLRDDRVVASADGPATAIKLPWIPMADRLSLRVRVTDTNGRSSLSDEKTVAVKVEKTINFSRLDLGVVSEIILCKLARIQNNEESIVDERRLDSEQSCKAFCSIVGPLTYSSKAEIHCGTKDNLYYQKKPEH